MIHLFAFFGGWEKVQSNVIKKSISDKDLLQYMQTNEMDAYLTKTVVSLNFRF